MTRANRFRATDDESAVVVDGAFGRMSAIDVRVFETRTWNRFGLEALVAAAISFFQTTTGVNLPWNLATHGPWVAYPKFRRRLTDEVERMVESAARFAGWLRAAAKLPAVIWLVAKATSNRGMNSPYTAVDLYAFSALWPSPGRLARTIVKVRARANEILEPYGLRVSGRALAIALSRKGERNAIGKMARRAAAETVTQATRGRLVGRPLDILVKARGMKSFLALSRTCRFWALERMQAGEFSCLREACEASHRLQSIFRVNREIVTDLAYPGETRHNVLVRPGWEEGGTVWVLRQEHTGREFFPARWQGQEIDEILGDAFSWWRQFIPA